MRLLSADAERPYLKTFFNERERPEYAILSHTWMAAEDEVSFSDLTDINKARQKPGWLKIQHTILQAQAHELQWVWVDTCCIDKSSSAELAEAINSMFRWYRDSAICYVYLDDVPDLTEALIRQNLPEVQRRPPFLDFNILSSEYQWRELTSYWCNTTRHSRETSPDRWLEVTRAKWFTRGWTLQELLAPHDAHFFSHDWHVLGDRESLSSLIAQACNIPRAVITNRQSLAKGYMAPYQFPGLHSDGTATPPEQHRLQALRGRVATYFGEFSVAQRMSWAAGRKLTRVEDEAYSLLGLFDVNMPVLYGEGSRAFLRLQQEIMKTRIDHTIFAWERFGADHMFGRMDGTLLAESASSFRNQESTFQAHFDLRSVYEVSNIGVRVQVPCRRLYEQTDCASGQILQVVLHCSPGDQLKVLALRLRQVGADDQNIFVVLAELGRRRLVKVDAIAASTFDYKTVTILFSGSFAGDAMEPYSMFMVPGYNAKVAVAIRLEGLRVDLDVADLANAAAFPSARLEESKADCERTRLLYQRALRLETVCPLQHWDLNTQSFELYPWRTWSQTSAFPFLGFLTLGCTNAEQDDRCMPMVLHLYIGPIQDNYKRADGTKLTYTDSSQSPKDFLYRMAFSTDRQTDWLDKARPLRLADSDKHTILSSHCLPDGNALEAELSLLKLCTSRQETIVINIRRHRPYLSTSPS